MSLSVTVLGESHCFSDFPGPAGVPAENSSRVRSTATAGETTRQPVPEARWRIYVYVPFIGFGQGLYRCTTTLVLGDDDVTRSHLVQMHAQS